MVDYNFVTLINKKSYRLRQNTAEARPKAALSTWKRNNDNIGDAARPQNDNKGRQAPSS
jgi:hypothetical protein